MTFSDARILVVDDDAGIRSGISDYLSGFGFRVGVAADGVQMDQHLASEPVDLVVLDVMMPGEDGLSICRRLSDRGIPILMLSALGDSADRVVGLELGALDYLPKPFEPRELLARVRALLRRPSSDTISAMSRTRLYLGWRYDGDSRRLTRPDDSSVVLSSGQGALLKVFLDRPGRLLSRDQLITLTRGGEADVFDRSIDLAVSRLRRLLGDHGVTPLIETIRGEGYRLKPEREGL
ncbi:response regulator [Brevundimonas sp. 3P9-tot-E]|uniref:response regulator n=1 Tax=Brevundimonas TaxID=41275 RepID=UPI0034D44170